MRNQTEREAQLFQALDAQQAQIDCSLLPMIRLCRFATRAAAVLSDLSAHSEISPSFKAAFAQATEYPNDPLADEAHELVAGVLYCVEREAFAMRECLSAAMMPIAPEPQVKAWVK